VSESKIVMGTYHYRGSCAGLRLPLRRGRLTVLGKPLPDGRGSVAVGLIFARFTEPRPSGSGFLQSERIKSVKSRQGLDSGIRV
jgi:hypothetical protein